MAYAQRCVDLTTDDCDGIKDFDIAYAYEAMCRAHALLGDQETSQQWREKTIAARDAIKDAKDLEYFDGDFAAGNWGVGG